MRKVISRMLGLACPWPGQQASSIFFFWCYNFTQKGNMNLKVNSQLGVNFQTKKGLQQGDPLSPILFNIVVDMLALMTARAKKVGQLEGVIPHLIDDGLSILQYADDTVIFMSYDIKRQ